jgi:hypothetical protein
MKSLKEYLAEAELFESTPSIGDVFEIEIAREEIVIESTVVGYMDDGIVIEADDTMMKILMHVGYLTEDSNMPTARDSVSPIHSNVNRDKSNDDDLEKNYMDKDSGATPPARPTRNAMDAKPLTEPKNKKDPQDYMVHEAPEGWGQDQTMDDGSVMKYDAKSNSYSQSSPATKPNPNTSMSVVNTMRTRQTDATKKGPTYSQDFSSTSLARDPKTGTGEYHTTRSTGNDNYEQDYQKNVSKPWMDYTFNKAKHDADTMLRDPNDTEYRSSPQGPMAPFRATTNEAEYQGRKVALGKPMAGDVKKSKVYVKNAKGNVVKVNFGDPNMTIKKSNPKRRKSFRARHNCANPGPRTSARYWSCRAW